MVEESGVGFLTLNILNVRRQSVLETAITLCLQNEGCDTTPPLLQPPTALSNLEYKPEPPGMLCHTQPLIFSLHRLLGPPPPHSAPGDRAPWRGPQTLLTCRARHRPSHTPEPSSPDVHLANTCASHTVLLTCCLPTGAYVTKHEPLHLPPQSPLGGKLQLSSILPS